MGRGTGAGAAFRAGRVHVKISVDEDRCQGHSRCMALAPELFEVDDYGVSSVRIDGDVPADLAEKARLAAANCPERAITIVD